MSDWFNFYAARLNPQYQAHVRKKYKPFIDFITPKDPHPTTIIEAGCGIGSITKALMSRRPQDHHMMFDKCSLMLELARQNVSEEFEFLSSWPMLQQVDITVPFLFKNWCPWGIASLVHGHGVLEHFQDFHINQIIEEQLWVAPHVVHYVPSAKYVTPSFGDERLMTPEQWHTICKPTEILTFNDEHDIILSWRR